MTCAFLACATTSDKGAPCPAIEVSAVADVPGDSTRVVAVNDSTKITLAKTPLVTTADIAGARASLTEGEWGLNIDLSDAAAKRIQEFSKQNVGRTLALLVEGKVQGTPRIAGALTGKGFLIGRFSQADAERMSASLRNGCGR